MQGLPNAMDSVVKKKIKSSGFAPILLLLSILFLHKYIDVEKDMINGNGVHVNTDSEVNRLTQVEEEGLSWTEEILIRFAPEVVVD